MNTDQIAGEAAKVAIRELSDGFAVRFWKKSARFSSGEHLWFAVSEIGKFVGDDGPEVRGIVPLAFGCLDRDAFVKRLGHASEAAALQARAVVYMDREDATWRVKYRRNLARVIADNANVTRTDARRWIREAREITNGKRKLR